MVFFNTYTGFLYRQLFITPPPVSPSSVSLVGKIAIVTGSNTGLGYSTSSQLLSLGLSHLILAVRNPEKGEAARSSLLNTLRQQRSDNSSEVSERATPPTVEVWALDLTDNTSITAFADRLRHTTDLAVDYCILNAGVSPFTFEKSAATGNELTIQTNWLGTALLAILMHSILQQQHQARMRAHNMSDPIDSARSDSRVAKAPSVLTIVGSETAQWASFRELRTAQSTNSSLLSVLNNPAHFHTPDRYYTSKLLLAFFFRAFVARIHSPPSSTNPPNSNTTTSTPTLPPRNNVIINLINPGFCHGSDLHRSAPGLFGYIFNAVKRIIGRSADVGARAIVHAAVVAGADGWEGGEGIEGGNGVVGTSHGKFLSDERVAPWMDVVEGKAGKEVEDLVWEEVWREVGELVVDGGELRGRGEGENDGRERGLNHLERGREKRRIA